MTKFIDQQTHNLFQAIKDRRPEKVKECLLAGANPNTVDPQGKLGWGGEPLHFICGVNHKIQERQKSFKIIQHLLDAGADPCRPRQDFSGNHSIHYTAHGNNPDELHLLLQQKGVSIKQENAQGYTPMSIALEYMNLPMIRVLQDLGENINTPALGLSVLCRAVMFDNMEKFLALLEMGADPNYVPRKISPLMCCVRNNEYKMMEILLQKGANPNFQKPDSGETALHLAAIDDPNYSRNHISRILLQNGGDADIQNTAGQTPLMLAIRNRDVDLIRLLSPTTNFWLVDENGNNVLHYAIDSRNLEIVNYIFEESMDKSVDDYIGEHNPNFLEKWRQFVTQPTQEGHSPLKLAQMGDCEGMKDLVSILVEFALKTDITQDVETSDEEDEEIN